MAIMTMNFFAETLKKQTTVKLYVPDKVKESYPVLYLLHGYSDDASRWLDQTRLAHYAQAYSFMIVMPQVDLSFYTDMVYGENYWQYVTEELPRKLAQWYHVTNKPSETFVAGLSMGGYGAFKCGLNYPDRYRSVASLSGALDVGRLWQTDGEINPSLKIVFGSEEAFSGSLNDLLFLVRQHTYESLDFLQICGTEDFLYEDNQHFNQHSGNIKHFTYVEAPGNHNWDFWDEWLEYVLNYFNELLIGDES